MNPFSIPPILSALLFLLLGGFIFLKEKKSTIHRIFFLICIVTAWWQTSWFFLFGTNDPSVANILVKVGHIGILLIPIAVYHFVVSFVGSRKLIDKIILSLGYAFALFLEINLLTNNVIDGYYEFYWGFYPKASFLHPYFLLFLNVGLFLRIVILLVTSYMKSESELKRVQTKYILSSVIFYAFAASDFIVNYGFEFYPLGFIFIICFLGIVAYAMAKYKLMNVKVIFTQLFIVIISLALFVQICVSETVFGYIWGTTLLVSFIMMGFLLVKNVYGEINRRVELQKLYEKVDKLNKAKSEFLSIASHQLRAPLTIVKGYISMLLEGDYGDMPEGAKEPLKNVFKSNERLVNLVNEFLNLSRLESGKIDITFTPVALDNLIRDIVKEMKINADKKGLSITLDMPKTLPEIIADEQKIRQVILNIVDNAIKYTDKGGITIRAEKEGAKEKIMVSDTGIGMTEKDINSVFEIFTRARAGAQSQKEGTGVGLYVAKKFVEMHNGDIKIESEGAGKGTTFIVELPILNKHEKDAK